MGFEKYVINLIEKLGLGLTEERIKIASAVMGRFAEYIRAEHSKEEVKIINSAILIYIFINSVIPEADMIQYEGLSRFWFRIGTDRFIIEISRNEINVYQFVLGQLWKETDLSKELKVRLNDSAMSFGIF